MKDKLILNEDFDDASDNPSFEQQGWEFVKVKDVVDSNDFTDRYYWYKNKETGKHRFYFSSDVEAGDPDYYDWEEDSDKTAQEWFDSYQLDSDYGSTYDDKGDLYFADSEVEGLTGEALQENVNPRIDLTRYGFKRLPERDFVDDGTTFRMYEYEGLPISYAYSIKYGHFIDGRPDYLPGAKYEVYSKIPGYRSLQILNGEEIVTKDDIEEFKRNISSYMSNYNKEDMPINEDTVKQDGQWVNKGDSGETHGEFRTKKAADAQRKAMFANGFEESLTEDVFTAHKYKYNSEPHRIVVALNWVAKDVRPEHKEYWRVLKNALSKYISQNYSSAEYFEESLTENPDTPTDTSVASRLITAINDEWKTIDLYNSIITELDSQNDAYKDMIPVIQDIVNEENVHVGQLQKTLELISPDTADIAKGEKEAEGQISGGDPSDDKRALVNESYSDDEYDDFELAGIYGGDMIYCPICGKRLEYTEDGDQYCPKCDKSAWSLAQERRKLDRDRKSESVEDETINDLPFNEDDEIESMEWYSTDIKEIPYGRNQKRINNRKLADRDKESVRKPVKENLNDEDAINARTIKGAIDAGTIDKDAIIDYVLNNTPDEMLSGVVDLIDTETESETVSDDLHVDGEEGYENACPCNDAVVSGEDDLVSADIVIPAVEEKVEDGQTVQEVNPLATAVISAVAPAVIDTVVDEILPEDASLTNDDLDEGVLTTI